MAIIFEGKSKCPLCGKYLDNKRKTILFPNFTTNMKEPLFLLSDRGVHQNCLNKSKLRRSAILFKEMYYANVPSPKSRCVVDNNIIEDPKNIFVIGLLTSTESENLYKFNFLTFNKKNISKWKDKNNFVDAALDFKKKDKWVSYTKDNYLDCLITKISDIV